ncbi:MAG: protein-L-isoaspartate O-methyltransferase, partial [Pseudomonadota bacterium]|nr:protein-L-isoaspartate O-methyltransferase [Pseudomonadota bacterium]
MSNFAIARQNMVDNQIRANKVTDPALIEAFLSIPREDFVPTG